MATRIQGGPLVATVSRDDDNFRTYKVTWLIAADPGDGPATVLATPGLPEIGQTWNFGAAEVDPFAWCRPSAEVKPVTEREGNWWTCEQTFSTRPWRRPGESGGDPLLEPPKVSVSFAKTTEEISVDRFLRPVTNSAHEMLRGKHVEFDSGMVNVKIDQNFALLNLPAIVAAYQTVNALPLWGLPPRTIKLSNASVTENFYGAGLKYYQRTLELEANFRGWDRDILDESTKVLNGEWSRAVAAGSGLSAGGGLTWVLKPVDEAGTMPDPNDPRHFIKATDVGGNPMRIVLNGQGVPAGTVAARSQQFVCIADLATGKPLSDSHTWVPVISPPVLTMQWLSDGSYRRGDLVYTGPESGAPENDVVYVALRRNFDRPPWVFTDDWFRLPGGITDRGLYDAGTTYAVGEIVRDSTLTAAGVVHVEAYGETDFVTLLGIPAVL